MFKPPNPLCGRPIFWVPSAQPPAHRILPAHRNHPYFCKPLILLGVPVCGSSPAQPAHRRNLCGVRVCHTRRVCTRHTSARSGRHSERGWPGVPGGRGGVLPDRASP